MNQEKKPTSGFKNRNFTGGLIQMVQDTQNVSDQLTLTEFLGTGESPIIVRDRQLETRDQVAQARLRSLPLFLEFGLGTALYDSRWHRQVQLVDHDYRSPAELSPETEPFPLVHLVTSDQLKARHDQEFEHESVSQADLTWDLSRAAADSGARYILITDTNAPQIPSRTPSLGRSVADQFNAVTFEYDQLIHEYVADSVDSELPLDHTRNLYFHRISEYHADRDAPAATLEGLFEYELAPPGSPVWDPLYRLIEHDAASDIDDRAARITSTLEPWVESSGTEPIATQMLSTLEQCSFDRDTLHNYQHDSDR